MHLSFYINKCTCVRTALLAHVQEAKGPYQMIHESKQMKLPLVVSFIIRTNRKCIHIRVYNELLRQRTN